jgi:hypothetical protein
MAAVVIFVNAVKGVSARLRRAQWSQHHRISGVYLGWYAAEMAWRENHRRELNGSLCGIVGKLAGALELSVDFSGYWQRQKAA